MPDNTWPLVFFTVLAQAAVGLVGGLAVMSAGKQVAVRLTFLQLRLPVVAVALLLMAGALVFSFFHLGSPLKAVYALSALRTSLLSREILMVSVFGLLLLVWYILLRTSSFPERANSMMLWLCLTAGLLMVWFMARIYMLPAVPPWNSAYTPVLFYSGGVMSGFSLFFLLEVPGHEGEAGRYRQLPYSRVMVLMILAAFLVRSIFSLFQQPVAPDVAFPPSGIPWLLKAGYYMLLVAGSGLLLKRTFLPVNLYPKTWRYLVFTAFLCILAGELLGRFIFYAGYYRLGV